MGAGILGEKEITRPDKRHSREEASEANTMDT